ncbi:unnamed protein product [Closterium sp. Naga37s-1]|nr:unnamed protein product [Closterium sp. Naga37s-1]
MIGSYFRTPTTTTRLSSASSLPTTDPCSALPSPGKLPFLISPHGFFLLHFLTPQPQSLSQHALIPLSSQVLQSRLTIAGTDSSPAHVDFEYSDTLCGTAWRDDYLRLHSAIRAASAAAYTPPPTPPPPPSSLASHSSRRLLSLENSSPLLPPTAAATAAAAAAEPDPSLSNQALPASSVRFLTFDEHGHCGGFGDFLVGVVSTFVAALLDRRAFVIRHNCIQYAFEPAFIDWRPSPDVPMEPSRRTRNINESFPPDVIPFLDLNNVRVDLQQLARFKAFRHVKVLWNRGMLTETLTNGTGEWADALRATGLRPPPRKEVWPLTARLLQEMSEPRTVVVGVHVRMSDSVFGAAKGGVTDASMAAALENAAPILACAKVPVSPTRCVTDASMAAALENAAPILACAKVGRGGKDRKRGKHDLESGPEKQVNAAGCSHPRLCQGSGGHVVSPASHSALDMVLPSLLYPLSPPPPPPLSLFQAVEDMWYPPPLTVRWMFITNSIDLKMAIRSRFPGKLLETDFVPHHSQSFSDEDKEKAKEAAEQGYREMVAEWLLLSSSNSFVLPVSGFSRTAAMYSLNAMALFTPPYYCDPEQPHPQTDFGVAYSGI